MGGGGNLNFKSGNVLRWLNTVCARFTDSVSDAIKGALGLWYANTTVDKVNPQFHMKWIIKLSFDPKQLSFSFLDSFSFLSEQKKTFPKTFRMLFIFAMKPK